VLRGCGNFARFSKLRDVVFYTTSSQPDKNLCMCVCVCVLVRNTSRGDTQQDPSHWKDGSRVPGATVSWCSYIVSVTDQLSLAILP